MGKSSSQVVGYRHYAKFAAFIGNRIEKFLGINFDNRGWILHDPTKHPPNLLPVQKPNLYGETEGGVSGNIDIHFGTPDQEPNAEYQKYFPLVSGYPYQSYLVFRGEGGPDFSGVGGIYEEVANTLGAGGKSAFYVGNSGYMKEMLLWVKRIHVKNDGSKQWYDSKAAIDSFNRYEPAPYDEYRSFQVLRGMTVKWSDSSGEYVRTAGGAAFPMSELLQSYEAGAGYNGDPLPEPIGIVGAAAVLSANNMPADMGEGVILPPATWTGYPPETDGFSNGAIVRHFSSKGRFYWNGGKFQYRTVLSKNGAQILISEVDDGGVVTLVHAIQNTSLNNYKFYEGEFYLPSGMYELQANVGERYLDQGTPRPFLHFQVKAKVADSVDAPDINPIHKIREILTDDTAMGKPESDVNDSNFRKAANRIWDEGLGISWAIDEKSCIEAIEELCYHIEAGIRVNRQTGLYEMVLFRDDWFEEDEIHTIPENKIKDLSLEVMNSDDIVNQLNVTYYDRGRIKNSTFSIYENGSILTMGHANAESVEFPYFMNMRNAEIVANWKLKQFSTPAWSGSFTTGLKEARKWNRYDLIRLPWPSKWNGTILARIMKINLGNGTDNTVTIDFEEVIPYSGEMNTSIVVDAPVESAPQPPQPSINAVFEAPYYLTVLRAGQTNADLELSNNPDIGYVAAIAAKPQSNSLNALLFTDGGVGEFEQVSRLDYCDILQLDQPINETMSAFVVTGSLTQTANSNNFILLNDELMGFVSFDDATKVLTVKRGVLDTVPKKHSSGSLFVFDLPDVAFDSTQYAQSEVVETQVLTTTPSGIQELSETGQSIEIQARAIRPYPPANVKLNGEYWPVEISGNLSITWAHRNRKQQTGGTPIAWYEGSVTKEDDVTYSLVLKNAETLAILDSQDGISGDSVTIDESNLAQNCRLEMWSVRDNFESFSRFIHTFRTLASAPKWTPENLIKTPTARLYSDQNLTIGGSNKVTDWGGFFTASNGPTLREDLLPFPVLLNETETSQMVAANFAVSVMDSEIWTFGVYYRDSIEYKRLFDIALNASTNGAVSAYLGNNGLTVGITGRISTSSAPVTATQQKAATSSLTMVFTRIKWIASTAVEISVDGRNKVINTGLSPSSLKPTTQPNLCLGYPQVAPSQAGQSINSGYVSFICGNSASTPSQEQVDRLFGWAAHKYGIEDQLPVDHPYKTAAPTL